MKKISYGQLLLLLFVTRIVRTMTYNPFLLASPYQIIIEIAVSVLIQAVLVIPFVYIYNKFQGEDIISLGFSRNKAVGITLCTVYSAYFIVVALRLIKYFSLFMSTGFPVINSSKAIAVCLILVAGYGAFQGIESLGRSASIVFAFFCFMILIIILTTQGSFDLYNLSIPEPDNPTGFTGFLLKELGSNSELVTVALILPKIKDGFRKAIYGFLTLKLLVIEFAVFLSVTVLGAYIRVTELPFFKVGALSKTQYIERFDAVYMVVWTLCAVIGLGLFIYSASQGLESVFRKTGRKKLSLYISGFVILVTIIFRASQSNADMWADKWLSAVLVCLLTFVIPIVMILINGRKGKQQ